MAFNDEHSPSILAKTLLCLSVLAGTLVAAALTSGYAESLTSVFEYEPVAGDFYRRLLMVTCCLIYFVRFTVCMFVFIQRKISWFEGGLVSFLFFMMFYLFGITAGSQIEPLGIIDAAAVLLFAIGSWINSTADYQRYAWKRKAENRGHLYTDGLFRYSMHINYFGDGLLYVGLAMITLERIPLFIAAGIIVNFIVLQIPKLDRYLEDRYTDEFRDYAAKTKKLIPFVY